MAKATFDELLEAGVHFGHLKRKWHPKMAPYIFMERGGIHIIDLHKTSAKLEEACAALEQIAKSGKKILFVSTKKQAKEVLAEKVKTLNMPYVTERWPGGMLTNFSTVRKAVRKMNSIDKMKEDGTFTTLSKRERLQVTRQREKLEKNLGSIADLTRLPSALFIVDIKKEHIAVAEAKKLNIPTFAMVDTNSDPTLVDFAIPANDDATKSITKILDFVVESVKEGLGERKKAKDKEDDDNKKTATAKKEEAEIAKPKEKITVKKAATKVTSTKQEAKPAEAKAKIEEPKTTAKTTEAKPAAKKAAPAKKTTTAKKPVAKKATTAKKKPATKK